jgi:hypothetical protein
VDAFDLTGMEILHCFVVPGFIDIFGVVFRMESVVYSFLCIN